VNLWEYLLWLLLCGLVETLRDGETGVIVDGADAPAKMAENFCAASAALLRAPERLGAMRAAATAWAAPQLWSERQIELRKILGI